eukprot:jgi/Botrbrau1/4188/Bobra.0192s0047.1
MSLSGILAGVLNRYNIMALAGRRRSATTQLEHVILPKSSLPPTNRELTLKSLDPDLSPLGTALCLTTRLAHSPPLTSWKTPAIAVTLVSNRKGTKNLCSGLKKAVEFNFLSHWDKAIQDGYIQSRIHYLICSLCKMLRRSCILRTKAVISRTGQHQPFSDNECKHYGGMFRVIECYPIGRLAGA